tara:strand:- start:3468 stop:5708 length:2241 start_codon:yes stop_codon:yes gene_type:complete
MAGSAVSELKVLVKVAGEQGLKKLGYELQSVGQNAAKATFNFNHFTKSLKAEERQQIKNINNTRAFANSWRQLANSVKIGSAQFNIATRNAERLERQLRRTSNAGRRLSLGGLARGIGAIAGSAVFGGPEGAIGAGIGLGLGGASGALVGGAIGAQVGMVRQQVGQVAQNVAEYRSLQIALAGISKDQEDYIQSMEAMFDISKRFLIPQRDAIRQFTRLKASIVGAGFSTEDTTTVFEGMAAAILATGGRTHDLNSALVAAAQVFSKGKVSAEELRQQIGERLPGAFTIFADAMGITTAELDNMLERGEVDLTNFVTFSEEIFSRYSEIAATLAEAPEKAGQRLAVALQMLEIRFGGAFMVVGAGLQDWMTNMANWVLSNEDDIKRMIAQFVLFAEDVAIIFKALGEQLVAIFKPIFDFIGRGIRSLVSTITEDVLEHQYKEMMRAQPGYDRGTLFRYGDRPIPELRQEVGEEFMPEGGTWQEGWRSEAGRLEYRRRLEVALGYASETSETLSSVEEEIQATMDRIFEVPNLNFGSGTRVGSQGGGTSGGETVWDGMKAGAISYGETVKDVFESVQKATNNAFQKMEDALVDFVMTGTLNFRKFAASVIRDMARIAIQQSIMAPFSKWFGGQFTTNAQGNVYAQNGIVPFSKGGVVTQPTIFPFKNGIGLMSEEGPEAIMPLRRGPGGRLGVESSGGGGNITVNVDASGSSVEGNQGEASQLGQILGAVVQAELIKQKRPGGLLAI